MLMLNNADVAKVLDMKLTMSALDDVFKEMAIGDSVGMGRIDVYVPSGETKAPYYRWAVMTGGSKKDGMVCARMLSDMVNWPREHGRIRENKYAQQARHLPRPAVSVQRQGRDPGRDDQRRLPAALSRRRRRRSRRQISLASRQRSGRHDRFRRHGADLSRCLPAVAQDPQGQGLEPEHRERQALRPRDGRIAQHRSRAAPRRRARRCAARILFPAAPRPTSRYSSTTGSSPACMSPT